MQEGFGFKIERVIDIVFGSRQLIGVALENIAEDITRPHAFHGWPDRRKNLLDRLVGDQPLPVEIIFVDIIFKIVINDGPIITPRIAAKQFVAATARKHHLDKFARQLGCVKVRITLANAWFFQMPRQPRQDAFHIAGLQDHLIMFGLEKVGHILGLFALVEAHFQARRRVQIKAASKGLEIGQLFGGHGCNRARIHATAQVCAHVHIANQLAIDGLAKEPIQFFDILTFIALGFWLAEIVVPITLWCRMGLRAQRHR